MPSWTKQRTRIKPLAKARIAEAAKEDRITDETCCALAAVSYASDAAYLANQLPQGWKFLEQRATRKGYDAAALFHTKTKTLLILNRGTEWSEAEDIIQNASSILTGQDYGQIEDALSFLTDMWEKHAAKAAEIKVVGHSLGAGLAEAQVYLGKAAIEARAGLAPPRDIFGIGIASAGYGPAILALAQERNYAVNSDASDITHYVRRHDVTQSIGLGHRLGSVVWRGSIFQATLRPKPGPRPGNRWEPFAETIHNHDCGVYFEQFAVDAHHHIVWRWKALKYQVRDGDEPEPYANYQVPDGDL